MIVREIEKAGIPAVIITALVPIAKVSGAERIIKGAATTSPLGNPRVSASEEKRLRRRIVEDALHKLTQ